MTRYTKTALRPFIVQPETTPKLDPDLRATIERIQADIQLALALSGGHPQVCILLSTMQVGAESIIDIHYGLLPRPTT